MHAGLLSVLQVSFAPVLCFLLEAQIPTHLATANINILKGLLAGPLASVPVQDEMGPH